MDGIFGDNDGMADGLYLLIYHLYPNKDIYSPKKCSTPRHRTDPLPYPLRGSRKWVNFMQLRESATNTAQPGQPALDKS